MYPAPNTFWVLVDVGDDFVRDLGLVRKKLQQNALLPAVTLIKAIMHRLKRYPR